MKRQPSNREPLQLLNFFSGFTDAIIEQTKEIKMTNFILIKEKTEVQKVLEQAKYMEMKRKQKSLRVLAFSLVPLAFRIGIKLSTGV